jgi:hypothetical protein
MSLMNLVRSIGALAIAWALVAIGIGASGARLPRPSAAAPPSAESPPVDAVPLSWPSVERYDLVDRTSGRRSPIRLPEGHQWSMLSVSPWRGPRGELEAVGRWVKGEGEAFWGWGLFRLSDGAVLSRVATEILPSGRPCWVPGLARTILFPGADGRLHRCRLAGEGEDADVPGPSSPAAGGAGTSEPVVWGVPQPGEGDVFLEDPACSDAPRLRKWVFVALSQPMRRGRRSAYGRSQLWWLELSEGGRVIVAAGRLGGTVGTAGEAARDIEERLPSVAVDTAGVIRLVYLARPYRRGAWRLRSAVVEFDGRTGRPVSVAGDGPAPGPDAELVPAPLVVSSDGATVFGLSRSGGLAALPIVGGPAGVPANSTPGNDRAVR